MEMDYVPERIVKADNLLNKIMLSFNTAVPVLFSFSMMMTNYLRIQNHGV